MPRLKRLRLVVGLPKLQPEEVEKMQKYVRRLAKANAKMVSAKIVLRHQQESDALARFWANGPHRVF